MNILEILKTKPLGTPLWSPVFGKCSLLSVGKNNTFPIEIEFCNISMQFTADGRLYGNGESILYPSKQMRNWEKFSFKKGDVLHAGGEKYILFDRYDKDDYSRVYGKFRYDKSDDEIIRDVQIHTSKCEKTNAINASLVIATIEQHLGGKLNLDTLEIERPQCQFQPFDKVLVRDTPTSNWMPAFFSHVRADERGFIYVVVGGEVYYECIPYAGNELLGTTESPSNDKEAAK